MQMYNINYKTVKTNKPHICHGCMRLFPAKTDMDYSTSVDCGQISSVYWCRDCADFIDTLPRDEQSEEFYEGDLLNYEEYRNKLFPETVNV